MSFNVCGTVGANTGIIECDVARGILLRPLFGNKKFDPADYATPAAFKAAFIAACKLESGNANKIFPFPELQGVTNTTEANKEGTLPFGFKEVLIEGRPSYQGTFLVGQSTFAKLRRFNKKTMRMFGYDNGGNLWGMTDGDGKFCGYETKIFVSGNGFGDDANVVVATITMSLLSAIDFNDSATFVQWPGSINDAKGLLDAHLTYISKASNVYKIGVVIPTSEFDTELNVYDQFADELADGALWPAEVVASGVEMVITSVAKDTALECWTVTYDSTQHTALSGGASILQSLETPTVLDANDVTGIEGVPVVVTK
jgi:hypothetical protein